MSSSYIMNPLASAGAGIVGIVIHESAHAAAAWALGDKTARSRGRVSLNPLNHIDPFGTIILPLLMLAAGGPVFAFATPVHVYLNSLKHHKRDEVLVSVAGPASNIALACLAAVFMRLAYGSLYTSMSFAVASQIMNFGATFIVVNLSLAFFNLIPIPPLDGSKILLGWSSDPRIQKFLDAAKAGSVFIIFIAFILPVICRYFGVEFNPFGWYLIKTSQYFISQLI